MQLGQVQHVVQGQHAGGRLGEVRGGVHVVLRPQKTGRGEARQETGLCTAPFKLKALHGALQWQESHFLNI
jgi:hypothetical protein